MQKILGLLVVLGCVFGGYFEAGGQLVAIWQPAEMIIILGAGFGAMIIGNPKHVLKEIAHQIKGVISKKQLGPMSGVSGNKTVKVVKTGVDLPPLWSELWSPS